MTAGGLAKINVDYLIIQNLCINKAMSLQSLLFDRFRWIKWKNSLTFMIKFKKNIISVAEKNNAINSLQLTFS